MVSQATVQAKASYGYGIAATKLGETCQWFRPNGVTNPLAAANFVGTIQVLFDVTPNLAQTQLPARDKPENWYAAYDPVDTLPLALGDYLIRPTGDTLFLARISPFRPARMVLTNRTVDLLRTAMPASYGVQPYSGDTASADVVLASGWPCSWVQGTRGERGATDLPGDVRMPWYAILLPAIPGVTIRAADVLTNDIGQRVKVSAAELTDFGWRLTAILAQT